MFLRFVNLLTNRRIFYGELLVNFQPTKKLALAIKNPLLCIGQNKQNSNIMKHLITLLLAVLATANVAAQEMVYPDNMEYLQLQVMSNEDTDTNSSNYPSFAPIRKPTIGICGNTLYLYGQFGEVTLELVENGVTVYSTIIEPNANVVTLPDGVPGILELRLRDGRFVYSCEIEIE